MRLVAAELLKMRRRPMTYVLPGLLIGVMAFVFLVIGGLIAPLFEEMGGLMGPLDIEVSSIVYAVTGDFVFGMGSLLAVIYAGAIVGGDHSWGVLRNPIARGESREGYVLAKAIALAIAIAIGAVICFLSGVAMIMLVAAGARIDLSAMLSLDGLVGLYTALGLGTLVLLERAAIGIAVAVIMKSQLAGIVVAVVLYFAEPFVAGIAAVITSPGSFMFDVEPTVHWTQYLPFSIGSSVLNEASAALGGLAPAFVPNVPLWQSIPVVLAYLVGALAVSVFVIRRQEII